MAIVCPNGHTSGDPEWCDTCGAPIGSRPLPPPSPAAAPPAPASALPAPALCPNCGAVNDAANLFCESCGYDFTTGQAPPAAADLAPPTPVSRPSPVNWVVVVEVDRAWFALKGTLADEPCPPASSSTVAVTQHTALIGRSSQSRDIHPEIPLDADTGVSRRHAQLVRDGEGIAVTDLSSTNGTYVVAAGSEPDAATQPVASGMPVQLHDGDRIYLGAWSRLTVRRG